MSVGEVLCWRYFTMLDKNSEYIIGNHCEIISALIPGTKASLGESWIININKQFVVTVTQYFDEFTSYNILRFMP